MGRPTATGSGIRRNTSSGFTLIELLVVMSIMVILVSVSLALYPNSQTRAKEAVLKTDLVQMREALDQYYADKGKYPSTLDTLVEERYIRNIPPDPFTGKADTWQPILSEPEAGNPSAEVGVSDVKSGSDGKALDGSLYAEW